MVNVSATVSRAATPAITDASKTSYLDNNDVELLACLRAGEDSCYETLVRRYGPQVLATAKRYLRSDADAADCFQDTFLAIFENIDEFEQRSTIGTWVKGITINKCLMRARAQGRKKEESIEHLLPVFDEHGARVQSCTSNRSSSIGDSIDTSQMQGIVREKIDSLPVSYRVMLLLRDIDGYSTKEAAAILGIGESAVKTRLHRARAALRSLLTSENERMQDYADM